MVSINHDLIVLILVSVMAIALFMAAYGVFNLILNVWERYTGIHLEDNCLEWYEEDKP